MDFIKKQKNKITKIVTTILAFWGMTGTAHAQTLPWDLGGRIAGSMASAAEDMTISAIRFIADLIYQLVGVLISWAGAFVSLVIELNSQVLQMPVVRNGWMIARDVANLGFVLALIIIAFATILRFREYGARKMLIRLIGAAILINFSFVIAAGFINFSHVLMDFFLESKIEQASKIGETLAGVMEPQCLVASLEGCESGVPGSSEAEADNNVFNSLVSEVTAITFSLIVLFIMAALAVMLLIRLIYLGILIIIAPMAWLFWVMPGLSGHFRRWWSAFLKWVLFAPAVSFFIYITLQTADSLQFGQLSQQFIGASINSNVIAAVAIQGSQVTIMGGLLFGGLLAAQQMGIHGASSAISMARDARKRVVGGAGTAAGGAVRRIRQRAATAGADDEGKSIVERGAEKAAQATSGIPGVRRVFEGTARRAREARENLAAEVEETKDRYSGASNAVLKREASSLGSASNPVDASQIAAELAKRGEFSNVDPSQQKVMIEALKKTNSQDKILESRPDLADQFSNDPDAIAKAMSKLRPSKVSDLDKESFNKQEVVLNLSNAHLGKLGAEGSADQKQNVINQLNSAIQNINQYNQQDQQKLNNIESFIRNNPNWQ